MPIQSRVQHPSNTYISLASLSPYGGLLSIALVTIGVSLVSVLCFAHLLLPSLGFLGTCIAIIGISLMTERFSRPVVQWLLGRQVYIGLTEVCGEATADEVASIYCSGSSISDSQLNELIQQDGFNPTSKPEPSAP